MCFKIKDNETVGTPQVTKCLGVHVVGFVCDVKHMPLNISRKGTVIIDPMLRASHDKKKVVMCDIIL